MKIVIAPQEYKGSVSAIQAATAMETGVHRVFPEAETILVPVADGGDGTLETLVENSQGKIRTIEVVGPLGTNVSSSWGAMGDGFTAVIEMARTSGLAMVPSTKRNPLVTTTYGLGQAIVDALDSGFRRFIIGIGGSATNDGGAGMAQALGIRLLDKHNKDIPYGGASLSDLTHIDMSSLNPKAIHAEFEVACDVNNPLCGPEGASSIYGPQKGATQEMVMELDSCLLQLAQVIENDIGIDIKEIPGSGAAGGLGGGIKAFLNGSLRSGVDIILDAVNINDHLAGANLVITGEGQTDFQTVYNKAPIGVAQRAKNNKIPVIAISGSLGKGFTKIHDNGIGAVSSIIDKPMSLAEASRNSEILIASATEQALRYMKMGSQFPLIN